MDLDMVDDFVEPYDATDPRNESRPDSVVYQPIFRELKTASNRPIYLLRDTLANSKYKKKVINSIIETVEKSLKQQSSNQTMFAVSGDMAAGKSSVINSLLSIGMIARKGAKGSCTYTVQRFNRASPDQPAPYTAKVNFFSPEEIRGIMSTMFATFYRAALAGKPKKESRDEDEDEDEEGEDIGISENFNEISTVVDAFEALFADRDEFTNKNAAWKFLSKAQSEDDSNILEKLIRWANDVRTDFSEGEELVTVGASTPEELIRQLQPYTYTLQGVEGEGQVSPWLLVKVIDFGLSNIPILDEGIVLVDAPGLSDSNSVRSSNAVRFHRKCSHKLIVANVSRAEDDKSLRENLLQSCNFRGSSNTVLALTRGDDIDAETEVSGSVSANRAMRLLKDELKAIGDQRKKLAQERRRAKPEDQFEIDEKSRQLVSESKVKTTELNAVRLSMRNKQVLHTIQDQFSRMTNDSKRLSAFVVANETYKIHQAGYARDEAPSVSVEDTGIPALRRRILELPSEGKYNQAMHFAITTLPGLINFFELYCSRTHMARKSEIEAMIQQGSDGLDAVLSKTKAKLEDALQRIFLNPMKEDESDWVSGARQLCRNWAKTYMTTHLPIMRKEGFKTSNKKKQVPEVNWNQDLLDIEDVKASMEDWFSSLMDEMHPIFRDLTTQLGVLLDTTRANIRGVAKQELQMMGMQKFLEAFDLERPDMEKKLRKVVRVLRGDMNFVRVDTLVSSPTAYIKEAMFPIYGRLCTIKGRGAPEKRMAQLEKEVARPSGVWMKVHDSIQVAFDELFDQHLDIIQDAMRKIFENIRSRFSTLCDDTVIKDEKEKAQDEALRAKLQKQLMEAKKLLDGPVREAVEKCRDYANKDDSLFVGEGDD